MRARYTTKCGTLKRLYQSATGTRRWAQHRNGVLDRGACLRQLWGSDDFFAARSMDVYVSRPRERLAADSSLEILNIRSVGYKLIT